MSYYCDISEAMDMSALLAWRWETAPLRQVPQHVRRYGDGYMELSPRGGKDDGSAKEGGKNCNRRLAAWREGAVVEGGERLDEISFLLLERSLAEWQSILKEMCGGDGAVVEDSDSTFTLEPLHNLDWGVSRLSTKRLIQCYSLGKMYSHPGGPPGNQKRLSSVRLPARKACNDIPAHIEEKYSDPGSHL